MKAPIQSRLSLKSQGPRQIRVLLESNFAYADTLHLTEWPLARPWNMMCCCSRKWLHSNAHQDPCRHEAKACWAHAVTNIWFTIVVSGFNSETKPFSENNTAAVINLAHAACRGNLLVVGCRGGPFRMVRFYFWLAFMSIIPDLMRRERGSAV